MLNIGSRVHCILYGGKDGTIYNINGEQRPETVKNYGGVMTAGGSADFDIVWDNGSYSNRTPESLVVGSVQWRKKSSACVQRSLRRCKKGGVIK